MVAVVSSNPTGGNFFLFFGTLDVNFVQKCQICVENEKPEWFEIHFDWIIIYLCHENKTHVVFETFILYWNFVSIESWLGKNKNNLIKHWSSLMFVFIHPMIITTKRQMRRIRIIPSVCISVCWKPQKYSDVPQCDNSRHSVGALRSRCALRDVHCIRYFELILSMGIELVLRQWSSSSLNIFTDEGLL